MDDGMDYLIELQGFAKEVIRIMTSDDYTPDEQLEKIQDIMKYQARELVELLRDK